MIDIHCHIICGFDDGSQSIEESIEMARIAEKDGIKGIVATPHLFRGNFGFDDPGYFHKKLKEYKYVLENNNIDVGIYPGAEVHVTHNLIDEIKKNREKLVINNGSYMLIEFPHDHVFSGVKNLLFDLMSEGIKPIIAHPERNSIFVNKPVLLYELIRMGGLCQVNSGSFSGFYGRQVKDAVFRFLNLNFVHFIASDAHNSRSMAPRLSEVLMEVGPIMGEGEAIVFLRDNPQAVLDDKELPLPTEPLDPEKKERSLKISIPGFFKRKR